jgi:hypothetical protein
LPLNSVWLQHVCIPLERLHRQLPHLPTTKTTATTNCLFRHQTSAKSSYTLTRKRRCKIGSATDENNSCGFHNSIVTDFINALPGNSSANTYRGNNRRETVFSMESAPRPLRFNGSVNKPQQQTVFCVVRAAVG